MSSEYVVPSMADVNAAAGTNSYRMVSTFSGAGGSCLGAKLAGFDVVWASEFVPAAREVYQANHPGTPVDERDIRNVTGADIMNATGIGVGELDLFEGSPPCASFSGAGNRAKDWGKVKAYSDRSQQTDDLFFEYARLIGEVQPKVFIAENVAGLTQGVSRGYFKEILARLKLAGYRVEAKVLDAGWMGIPQTRARLIFFGIREDFDAAHVWPVPTKKRRTMNEVVPDIISAWKKPNFYVHAGEPGYLVKQRLDWPAGAILASGAVWGTRSYGLVRSTPPVSDADIADPAVQAGYKAAIGRTDLLQTFTIDDIKLIQSFPADFDLLDASKYKQWERLGRAVPPLMMKAVMDGARKVLDQCAD